VHEANQGAGQVVLDVYPNPFVERTTVRYEATGGRVLLQVYSEQGQLVRTLVDQVMGSGTFTTDCDLGDLPAALYYCRFQNMGRQQVKSMLKVR
jgi:hypothetical protein